ncbi:S1 family peptidase [Streptomyces humi]
MRQPRGIVAVAGAAAVAGAVLAVPTAAYAIDGGAAVRSAPWAVQVYNNGAFACTGTVIGSRWVLTAYHCYDDQPGKMSVRVGDVRIGHGVKADVSKIWYQHDLALFHLAKPVKAPHVRLADADPRKGAVLNIYGYGDNHMHPKPLRTAKERVARVGTSRFGRNSVGRTIELRQVNGYAEGGDSGGPAFYRGRQVGELFGTGPDEYTSIAAHRTWIRRLTGI